MMGIPSHSASGWPCRSSLEVASEVAVSGKEVVTVSAGLAVNVGVGTTVAAGGTNSEQAASASNSKVAMTGFFIGPSFSNLIRIITECSDGLSRRKGLHRAPSAGSQTMPTRSLGDEVMNVVRKRGFSRQFHDSLSAGHPYWPHGARITPVVFLY